MEKLRDLHLPVQLPNGQEATIAARGSWRVQKLKAFLAQKFPEALADEHKLFAGPRELNDQRTINAELLNGKTLSLRRADSYELFIDGTSGKRSISISPNADVSDLREKAAELDGFRGGLNWNGKPLSDGRKLCSYGISSHSRVAHTPRLGGG